MALIKGTWKWNEQPDVQSFPGANGVVLSVNFFLGGIYCYGISLGDQDDTLYCHYEAAGEQTSFYRDGYGWADNAYRTITFDGEQVVDDDFYNWFIVNAEGACSLVYNDKRTVLTNGQIATLNCAGKKPITDIKLVFSNAGGSITYNGTETEIEATKTAILACAGKKMLTDVLVTTHPEPGLYDVNDNLVATWSRLTNDYGMNASGNYNPSDPMEWEDRKEGHPASILAENPELSSGTKLVIPGTVKYIGACTFTSSNLTEIVLSNGIISMGEQAFSFSPDLKKVVIPASVKRITTAAFWWCENLSEVILSGGVTEIENQAFDRCTSLENITLPSGIKSIGTAAFSKCPLTSIKLPDGLETIGSLAFQGCQATNVTIPSSVTEIGEGAFGSCQNMQDIFVEDGNEQYKSETFIGDDGKEHRYLVDFLSTTIVQFPGGYSGHFEIPTGFVKVFGYSFFETLVTDVTIPDTLENIEEFAFAGSYNFNLLEIPRSITSIGAWAFKECANLCGKYDAEHNEYVLNVLSENLKTISKGLFIGCSGLVNIYFENGVIQIDGDVFLGCSNLCTISLGSKLQEIGENIINMVSDGLQIIFRGTQEWWEQNVVVAANNESWLDKLVFWN